MSNQQYQPGASLSASRPALPLLLVLFAGSGCAALIYEIVWFQLLQLVIGSSAVSLGVLLGTFMGGMCLGSLGLPRLFSRRRHPLRVYAALELAIGIIGVAVLFGMPEIDRIYTSMVGRGLGGILSRGAVCGLCLLPPTVLMGATLPTIARWVETTPAGVSWLGLFYAGNIAGAVFGCLLAGFYLLRVLDMATAIYVAAALNLAVALASLGLAGGVNRGSRMEDRGSRIEEPSSLAGFRSSILDPRSSPTWPVYVAIALSGASALAAEVIWTRLLSLLLGGTVYTFSIILAVFLMGLGLGSMVGSFLARARVRPWLALGWCQWLLAGAIAWTAFMLAHSLPYWPINPYLSSSPWFTFQLDIARTAWAILPATCLWGASFPLALAAVAAPGQDPGRLVGSVYAANTVGAIVGALGSSLFLIQGLGTQQGQRLLIGLSAAAALLMLLPLWWPFPMRKPEKQEDVAIPSSSVADFFRETAVLRNRSRRTTLRIAGIVSLVLGPALLAWSVSGPPWELIAYGRAVATYQYPWNMLYKGEGMNSSVAVTELDNGVRNFHVSGKVEASTDPTDMRTQRMLGHLPALLHPKPRSVLVVGCGAGVTAGSFLVHPDVEKVVICEIEPLVPQVVAKYFAAQNYDVVHDPRVEIVYDDARHYILTTQEKFDIITSDPIHPWVKGSATLYTKEYFELCMQHLNPNGLVTQWVPLYESTPEVVKSQIATFFEVFPEGTIWANNKDGQGYDVVLLGQAEATTVNVDELQRRLDRPDHVAVAKSLDDVGFGGTVSFLKTYIGRAGDLQPWLEGAEINRDRNLRLQYLAGMGLNANQSQLIYDQLLSYRKFPEELFVGSGTRNAALRWALRPKAEAGSQN
jgi:spermidine synthase